MLQEFTRAIQMCKEVFDIEELPVNIIIMDSAEEYYADAEIVEDTGIICIYPLVIEMGLEKCLEILFHEMTHIRQYWEGDLVALETGETVWKGETYGEEYSDPNAIEYWFAPWEIEARGHELAFWDLWVTLEKSE